MDKLVIDGLGRPYDGEYPTDLAELVSSLTMGELHRIKLLTGLRAGELGEAFDRGDTDVSVGLIAVVLERAGKRVSDSVLWSAKQGAIRIEFGEEEEEGEGSPPEVTQKSKGGASGKSSPKS